MSEAVVVQIIIQAGVLLSAIIAGVFGIIHTRRQKQRDAEAKQRDAATSAKLELVHKHVANSHATILRDDIGEIAARVEQVERDGRARDEMILSELRGLRRDIGRLGDADIQQATERAELRRKVDHLDDRYHELEK